MAAVASGQGGGHDLRGDRRRNVRGEWGAHRRMARRVAATLGLSLVLMACGASSSSGSSTSSGSSKSTSSSLAVSGVTVSGPVPVGSPTFNKTLYGTSFDLSKVGYEKSQFFLSGIAHSYVPVHPLTSDGKWKSRPVRARRIRHG